MSSLYSYDYNGGPFILFSAGHVFAIAIIVVMVLLLYCTKTKINSMMNQYLRIGLATILILSEASLTIWYVAVGKWSAAYSLPLHLCSLSVFLAAFMLMTRSYLLFEFVYLVGLSGATQAILTPDLGIYSFPHFCAFQFFIAHGAVVLASFYMIFMDGYRPRKKSIFNAFLLLNLYALIISAVNKATGGNYLYLTHKPENPSLMDILGPWPWYIISLEAVALVLFIVLWFPFAVTEKRRNTKLLGNQKVGRSFEQ